MKKSFIALVLMLLGNSAIACMDGSEIGLRVGKDVWDIATFNKRTYEISTDAGIRLAFASICGQSNVPMNMTKTVLNLKEILGLGRVSNPKYDLCLTFINGDGGVAKFRITADERARIARSRGCGGNIHAEAVN
jgi:hypothetical protein